MRRFVLLVGIMGLWLVGVLPASAQEEVPAVESRNVPVIESLSASTLPRSGRLVIRGHNFGASEARGVVRIGRLRAFTTQWSDSKIVAYVPEGTPLRTVPVQIVTSAGASSREPLEVTRRPSFGRVQWRFQADGSYFLQRPAVAADGTIYANDAMGNLYALAPNGGLKWIVKAGGAFAPVAIGHDGTIYVAEGPRVTAVTPQGTIKWVFTDPNGGLGVIAGPGVGPDGNIYVVTNLGGLGVFALSPAGKLLWNDPGFSEYGPLGYEISFGDDQLYFSCNMSGTGVLASLFGYTLDGEQRFHIQALGADPGQTATSPDGNRVYAKRDGWLTAYTPDGSIAWSTGNGSGRSTSAPDVGPDGTIYVAAGSNYLLALNADGSEQWRTPLLATVLTGPIVDPQDRYLVTSGYDIGQPGFILGYSTDGVALWRVPLPYENGGFIWPGARARFSPDGTTAYVGLTGNGYAEDPYTYLYAVTTTP